MKKVLMIQDGGLSPGYMAVAVGLTEEASARGMSLWAANEGFKSLTADAEEEPRLVEMYMCHDQEDATPPSPASINMYRRIGEAGTRFRTERYPVFKEDEKQAEAARFIVEQGFNAVVGVGGNGTFQGMNGLAKHLPKGIQLGFINCSADSDLAGDRSVGLITCAEEGARIAKGLFEDGFTHKRIYILEMMGNDSGQHALHSGAAARAHFIILPYFTLSEQIWRELADKLRQARHGLVIVAEGFAREERERLPQKVSASQFVKDQLALYGLEDRKSRRVIAESFSRYIRGIEPMFIEREIAYLKCHLMFKAFGLGLTCVMPYYQGSHDVGLTRWEKVRTNNLVEPIYLEIIDRLHLPSFRRYIEGRFFPDRDIRLPTMIGVRPEDVLK